VDKAARLVVVLAAVAQVVETKRVVRCAERENKGASLVQSKHWAWWLILNNLIESDMMIKKNVV